MKPCHQTKFGHGRGNCFAACIASILEMPGEDVPNFCADYDDEHWEDACRDWLKPMGLTLFSFSIKEMPDWDFYWIAGGRSPRDIEHAVVYHGDSMCHDPHPSGAGLVGLPDYGHVILPIDISQWQLKPEEFPDALRDAIHEQCRAKPMDWDKVIGKWPGDETDEEIQEALDALDPRK